MDVWPWFWIWQWIFRHGMSNKRIKLGCIKIKYFCSSKDIIKKWKYNLLEGRKDLNWISYNVLVSRIYENSIRNQQRQHKGITQLKMGKDLGTPGCLSCWSVWLLVSAPVIITWVLRSSLVTGSMFSEGSPCRFSPSVPPPLLVHVCVCKCTHFSSLSNK